MKSVLPGVAALFLAVPAFAAWPSDPTVNLPVIVNASEQSVEKMATMPDGTTWIGWFDNRGGSYAVYVQRLLPDGTATLPAGGLLVSSNPQSTSLVDWDLTVDAFGNCFLAFTDTRNVGDLDVFAYLISPAGAMLWGPNGVEVSSTNSDFEADPRVLVTANGDYLVSWPRSGSTNPGIFLQRLSAAGTTLLPVGGVRIAGNGTEAPGFHEWVALSDGNFVMMWQRDTRTFSSPRHVRAMKFDTFSGAAVWGAPLEISNANSVPISHKMTITRNPLDHVAYGWHDGRTGGTRAYVQQTDATGAVTMPVGGVQLSNTPGMLDFNPAIAFIPNTNDVMAFFDQRNSSQSLRGLVAQRVNAAGATFFMSGAGWVLQPIDSEHESLQRAVPSQFGATVVFMHQPNAGSGDTSAEVRAIRIPAIPIITWSAVLSTPPVTKFRLNITKDASDEIRAVWQDGRNDVSDIYAQNINEDGTLGPPDCAGDANGDQSVDAADLSVLLAQFFTFVPASTGADFNDDGLVNAADLSVLLSAFGQPC